MNFPTLFSESAALQSLAVVQPERAVFLDAYQQVRSLTEWLADPLSDEDQCVQAMEDASPVKWHLGHTSWFFETVVLGQFSPQRPVYDDRFSFLFNSYYESLGPRQPRPQRGLITRPSVAEVRFYRAHVDKCIKELVHNCEPSAWPGVQQAIELGLNHEQQHQELILTDLKYLLYQNPFDVVYRKQYNTPYPLELKAAQWLIYSGGICEIGSAAGSFCYDNETPRHSVYLYPFELASHLVTCGEYLEFVNQGGYKNPVYWLAEGWATVQASEWVAPLYWKEIEPGQWRVFTLHGEQALDLNQPVSHVSYFEAAAYAAWAGARLPREAELETAFHQAESGLENRLQQAFGHCWQWTSSSYDAYPGFKPLDGAVAEYNGKFMVGQLVLKGSSCSTPQGHSRPAYRNFFPPSARWQFSGIRLARNL